MLKPKKAAKLDLADYFNNPVSPRQKQYEAIRAIVVENASVDTVAKKYGYQSSTIYSLLREAKAGRLSLFPAIAKGPKKKQTSPAVQNRIIALRKQALSTPDIHQRLLEEGIKSSLSTVERILKAAGFDKLPRRTNQALGKSTTNANSELKNNMQNQRVTNSNSERILQLIL
jgi:transposase